jgi:hypothetical protein
MGPIGSELVTMALVRRHGDHAGRSQLISVSREYLIYGPFKNHSQAGHFMVM